MASYPGHKNAICLPPAAAGDVCSILAPNHLYNTTAPALWTAIGPIRHTQSTREWSRFYAHVSGRLINHVTYHVAMGVSGLLLHADELTRRYFARSPMLADLVRKGHLRWVRWVGEL